MSDLDIAPFFLVSQSLKVTEVVTYLIISEKYRWKLVLIWL